MACLLLKRGGHEAVGFTFALLPRGAQDSGRACCSAASVEMARRVCRALGVRHYVLNLREEFDERVIEPFCRDYSQGRTPNPCILCNGEIKFKVFLRKAEALGMEAVATGHYAQIRGGGGKGWRLLRGSDPDKDQSYFLYCLGQDQLGKVKMPLGGMTKREVRELAAAAGLPSAACPESQDLCFAGEGGLRVFFRSRQGDRLGPGAIVGPRGERMGEHDGLCYYTIGQRRGVGVGGGVRLYVTGLDAGRGEVRLGPEESLWSRGLTAEEVNWVAGGPPGRGEGLRCLAQIRYRTPAAAALVEPLEGAMARVTFDKAQRAVTPGQAIVFYEDSLVLGGGRISSVVSDQ